MTHKKIIYRIVRLQVMLSQRFLCKRNLTLILMLFFLMDIFLEPVKRFAEISGCKVTQWIFPFLISDANFLMVYMAGVVCFFSGASFMGKRDRYYLIRGGRRQWLSEQITDIFASSFLITCISVLVSWLPIISILEFRSGWGKVIFTMAKTNAGSMTGLFWKISYWYLNNHTPVKAMLTTILIISLGNCFIGMLMMLVRLYLPKAYSVGIALALVAYSSVVANIGFPSEKSYFEASPISWMRITRLGFTESGFRVAWPASVSIEVFAVLLLVIGIAGHRRIRQMDFQ